MIWSLEQLHINRLIFFCVFLRQKNISLSGEYHIDLYNHKWWIGLIISHIWEFVGIKQNYWVTSLWQTKGNNFSHCAWIGNCGCGTLMPKHNVLKKQMNEGMKNEFSAIEHNEIACDSGCLSVNWRKWRVYKGEVKLYACPVLGLKYLVLVLSQETVLACFRSKDWDQS